MAINVSPRQFNQAKFVTQVQQVLEDTGMDGNYLELELTEGMLLQNIEETIEKMMALKALGIHFSIDDFGTGYSSLAYLKRLPVDKLKIDQSFVSDITTDSSDAAIVDTIIAMAKHLDIGVIAEGVETIDELNFLREKGCHVYQGYYFSKPLPQNELVQFVRNNTSGT